MKRFILIIIMLLILPGACAAYELYVEPNPIDMGELLVGGGAGSNAFHEITIAFNAPIGTMFDLTVQGNPMDEYGNPYLEKEYQYNTSRDNHLTKPLAIRTYVDLEKPPPELPAHYTYLDEDGWAPIIYGLEVTDSSGWANITHWSLIQPAKPEDKGGIYQTTLIIIANVYTPESYMEPEFTGDIYTEETLPM